MRILQVDTELRWGGGQRQVLSLCRGLQEAGHGVTLVCHRKGALIGNAANECFHVLPLFSAGEADPRGFSALARFMRREDFDLIHMHSSRSHTLGLLASAIGGLRPRVVSRRNDLPPKKDVFNRWKYGRGVDCFVAISHAVQQVLAQSGIEENKIHVVHSGIVPPARVEGARESVFEEFGFPAETILVGNIANLVTPKGHRVLLRAAPRLLDNNPRIRFLLAGDGPLREELEGQAADTVSAGKIIFAGFRSDVPRLLSAFHLALFPSLNEGLCTSILDALALELPVVATRTGGIPEIISSGENGLLVAPGSSEELAAAVEQALGSYPETAGLGRKGRETVLEKFTVERMVTGTEAVYASLLK